MSVAPFLKGVSILPNIKSAKKRVKVIATKTLRNQIIKSQLKTYIKKFETLAGQGSSPELAEAYKLAIKKIDQAVSKGILHKNTASRRKSSLTLKFNKAA